LTPTDSATVKLTVNPVEVLPMKSNNRWPVEERRLIRLTGYVIKFLCIALFTAFILCLSASAMNEFNIVEFIWRLLQQLLPRFALLALCWVAIIAVCESNR
jgi:uncharacterized membrane protein YfbV (UPF0208 family)